ncbi:DEAD/DEAH box helicase [Seramator thermalis]|uniref:DEAD/DEAH box helicase n=1 Tax=Seramator thermalis TaxID=2496270 RepID=UPI00101BA603|nr:DEAD/DEAH box helicase [Seramator thermalis]
MFNPAKAADEIKKEYIGYISTTFHFRNQNLQNKFVEELERTVSKGPFIEIKDSFKSGKSIEQMIDEGKLSPLFKELEKNKKHPPELRISQPLYLHQEIAIEKIVAGRNVVVSTGTGSGKTYCFIIPVINELLREKEQNKLNDGVRAIFIYPMNALANDQIKGLRKILMAYPDIRFGVYNGGTENNENDAIKLYETMYANEEYPELRKKLPNEELSRDEMKKRPPHILFTNYAMLEHMLFRPGDDTIFTNSNFKFVVLDEAHVYSGATGIETAFLMGRLKGRINGERKPQFILTSATLGDGSQTSNKSVVEFAERLTGCKFTTDDIITAYRDNSQKSEQTYKFPTQLFIDLANEEKFLEDVLKTYNLNIPYSQEKEREILYDIVSVSDLYEKMRKLGNLLTLANFAEYLGITPQQAVAFVALCAKALKNGKPLVDIRYHYFLKALDGCYLALDYENSLSLVRKDYYKVEDYSNEQKMFEIAVCEDCGEIAIVGNIVNDKLVRASGFDDKNFYQVYFGEEQLLYEEDEEEGDEKNKKKKDEVVYYLCKNCGAIVAEDEAHNNWCTCGNTQKIRLTKLRNDKCLNCNGTLRRFNLGYDAATGVIATSLYEQIPEYTITFEENAEKQATKNPFLLQTEKKKTKSKTGRQFLVFSDSRQGAAKFACYLSDSYKEFLRRRGIWNVATQEEKKYFEGLNISDFVSLLENYFSNLKLFRKSNSDNAESSMVENRRNAWVAVLNELYNYKRDTSLVSLGKISFEYLGNSDNIVDVVVNNYKLSKEDAKNFLNYLAFEIVRSAAIITDNKNDINDSDRDYLYFTPVQKVVTKYKDNTLYGSQGFLPTPYTLKSGEKKYYRSNKLTITKRVLNLEDDKAIEFLGYYWDYLVSDSNNYKLETEDGKGYFVPARFFSAKFGKTAKLWKCKKCGKVTQFNIGNNCIQIGCDGKLERLDSEEFCKDNYYAMLYQSNKMSPLFVKEHTAQLSKKEALDYQQQFIRKEINALSCSTTFEMGVDVGDLETVFLRNIPPLASNYAQRVGRAGRSINAAAFALTFARLSSHDFTFFDNPKEMINGKISPPNFTLDNEKILKRHIYAVALSLYLRMNPDLYSGNNAKAFINDKGYQGFIEWLNSEPQELSDLLRNSISITNEQLKEKYINSFDWLEEFCGEQGIFKKIINEFETNVDYLKKEYEKAMRTRDEKTASVFSRNLERYQKNDLIDFLVRGNILPKYGFPIDSVELTQNIASNYFKSLNLSRDLSVAIAEYAPSGEVVADGWLYTSRYIRKPIVNKTELSDFETAYLAKCPECDNINFSNMPIGIDGKECAICGHILKSRDFYKSIEPRAGFIAEEQPKPVPLTSQERKYKTEAIYIGDKDAYPINKYNYQFDNVKLEVESTANDSLVVKSTDFFYVCPKCGYSIASDETSKLKDYEDYHIDVSKIERLRNTKNRHKNPFGKGTCSNVALSKYCLHHEFKTDVAKITFCCDTSDNATMLSVMYALLNSFANELNIERRDIKACLTYKLTSGRLEHKIIIYDAVPGGAGHSRRLVTQDGQVLQAVIKRAIKLLETCECDPSCYRCLRSYENQKIHEILNRKKALSFLKQLVKLGN